jgi:hypothetical protein
MLRLQSHGSGGRSKSLKALVDRNIISDVMLETAKAKLAQAKALMEALSQT